MPELNRWFAELPTEQHRPAIEFAREVDEADPAILQLDAQTIQFRLKGIDLASELLNPALERCRARIGKFRMCARQQIEFDERLLPAAMLADDVLDDLPDERKSAIRLVDSEKLHVGI